MAYYQETMAVVSLEADAQLHMKIYIILDEIASSDSSNIAMPARKVYLHSCAWLPWHKMLRGYIYHTRKAWKVITDEKDLNQPTRLVTNKHVLK